MQPPCARQTAAPCAGDPALTPPIHLSPRPPPPAVRSNTDWGGNSFERMKENWEPAWEVSNQCLDTKTGQPTLCDFRLMFSVIFPMATGIMEGANLSGDLKNPAHSIPTGTLYALLQSCIIYVILALCFAGVQ